MRVNIYDITSSTHGQWVAEANHQNAVALIQEKGFVGHIYEVRADRAGTPKELIGLSLVKLRLAGERRVPMTRDQAADGLAITRYYGKWKAAQRLAKHRPVSSHHKGLTYWERVRLLFLELGGEYSRPRSAYGVAA